MGRLLEKVTTWRKYHFDDSLLDDFPLNELGEINKDDSEDIIDLVYSDHYDVETLYELESTIPIEENDGFATVEIWNDDEELIYTNGK